MWKFFTASFGVASHKYRGDLKKVLSGIYDAFGLLVLEMIKNKEFLSSAARLVWKDIHNSPLRGLFLFDSHVGGSGVSIEVNTFCISAT